MRGVLAVCSLTLLFAFYQETGGSFGGGDFGGGGGGGSSGGYSSGSSSDYSSSSSTTTTTTSSYSSSTSSSSSGSSSYSYSYSTSHHSGSTLAIVIALGVFLGLPLAFVTVGVVVSKGGFRAIARRRWGRADVSVIQLAVDWRGRAPVQKALASLARTADMRTPRGRGRALFQTASKLLDVEVFWLYAGVQNHRRMRLRVAEDAFRRAAADARARYRTEVVRSDEDGVGEEAAPAMRARSEEGEGVVVITLCVASRRELLDVTDVHDAAQIKRALTAFAGVGEDDLVALEVIWSPAAEEDRMSTAELEVKYPELTKIDEKSLAGRVFCSHCRGPYPAELEKCPHCGATPETREA